MIALMCALSIGCDGGEDQPPLDELVLRSSEIPGSTPVVLDSVRPLTAEQLSGSSSDPVRREEELSEWGFREGLSACFSSPPGCDSATDSIPEGAIIIDMILAEFSDEDGSRDAYSALSDDIARRLENLSSPLAMNEELERGTIGDASRQFVQALTLARGTTAIESTSHQIVFRRGQNVGIMSVLTPTSEYKLETLEAIASAQIAKLDA